MLPPVVRDKAMRAFLFFVVSFFFISCGRSLVDTSLSSPPAAARLLLYIHVTSASPVDMDFTLSGIELEGTDGRTALVVDGPLTVSSSALAGGQMLLAESLVEAGSYRGMRLRISRASIRRDGGRINLALPEPDGVISIKADFVLRRNESLVGSFEWDPLRSIEDGYRFHGGIEAELQMPSPRAVLLFVSNSGSDYITIIDRSLERVVGAVTTGNRPMGMALNAAQDQLYVVNSGSRSISVVDTAQFRLLTTFLLPGGIEPADVVFIPDAFSIEGTLFITNRQSNDVAVVSTATHRLLKFIPVGSYPSHIAADIDRKEVYVTNERSNDLSIINAVDGTVVANVGVNRRPSGVLVGKDRLYVFNEGSSDISIVSPMQKKVVGTLSMMSPPRRGASGFGGRTFVASSSADTLSFLTPFDVVTRTISVSPGPTGLAVDESRNRLYITNYGDDTVSLVDPSGEKVVKKLFVGKDPYGVVLTDR